MGQTAPGQTWTLDEVPFYEVGAPPDIAKWHDMDYLDIYPSVYGRKMGSNGIGKLLEVGLTRIRETERPRCGTPTPSTSRRRVAGSQRHRHLQDAGPAGALCGRPRRQRREGALDRVPRSARERLRTDAAYVGSPGAPHSEGRVDHSQNGLGSVLLRSHRVSRSLGVYEPGDSASADGDRQRE
jgi:hypothetical protein